MKILLLGFARIATMPYMQDYVTLLKGNHELHLISWNRNGREDLPAPAGVAKSLVFVDEMRDEDPLSSKVPHIYRYRTFVKKILEDEGYDGIVVLHSTPGIALFDCLIRSYRGRYILDYRDVSHESLGLYRALIGRLSRAAGLVVASSPAYFKYLDNANGIVLKHNLLMEETPFASRRHGSPIRVRYWGMIRHEEANRALIDELGADERFELHYNGREEAVAKRLKAHVANMGYTNVFFHGPYYNDERSEFAADTDIIHNVYENDFATIGAMGNKYYDGIQFRIPQICTAGSLMGDTVTTQGVGLAINYAQPGFKEQIVDYLDAIDYEAFDHACRTELCAVMEDNTRASEAIVRFFTPSDADECSKGR